MNRVLWSNELIQTYLECYVAEEEAGTGKAYGGRVDWVPDSDASHSDDGENIMDSLRRLRLRVDS